MERQMAKTGSLMEGLKSKRQPQKSTAWIEADLGKLDEALQLPCFLELLIRKPGGNEEFSVVGQAYNISTCGAKVERQ